jgi:hypothetical protein
MAALSGAPGKLTFMPVLMYVIEDLDVHGFR